MKTFGKIFAVLMLVYGVIQIAHAIFGFFVILDLEAYIRFTDSLDPYDLEPTFYERISKFTTFTAELGLQKALSIIFLLNGIIFFYYGVIELFTKRVIKKIGVTNIILRSVLGVFVFVQIYFAFWLLSFYLGMQDDYLFSIEDNLSSDTAGWIFMLALSTQFGFITGFGFLVALINGLYHLGFLVRFFIRDKQKPKSIESSRVSNVIYFTSVTSLMLFSFLINYQIPFFGISADDKFFNVLNLIIAFLTASLLYFIITETIILMKRTHNKNKTY